MPYKCERVTQEKKHRRGGGLEGRRVGGVAVCNKNNVRDETEPRGECNRLRAMIMVICSDQALEQGVYG